MSLSQGLRWSGKSFSDGRQRLVCRSSSVRHYSLNSPRSTLSFSKPARTTSSTRINCYQQSRSLSLFGWGSKPAPDDFSKTHAASVSEPMNQAATSTDTVRSIKASHSTSDTPDVAITQPPVTNQPVTEGLQKLEDAIIKPHGATTSTEPLEETVDLASIPEGIGYLKEVCGLDFGWGPSSIMETALEHLHITAGLSWSASIIALGVIYRVLLIPSAFMASEENNKMRALAPVMTPLQQKSKQAMSENNRSAAIEAQTEMKALRAEYGIKMSRMFIPILLQLPLQIGAFRVLSNASRLPVPGFEAEQFLWLTSLSVTDPYYVLPAVISVVTYFNISSNLARQPDNKIMQAMKTGLPVLSFAFLMWQPASLHLFFLVNGIATQVQQTVLFSPGARKLLRLAPLAASPSTPAPAGPKYGTMKIITPNQGRPGLPNRKAAASRDRSLIDQGLEKVKGQWDNATGSVTKSVAQRADRNKAQQVEGQEKRWEALRRDELNAAREARNRGQKP